MDIFRYLLCTLLILFSCFHWLWPFSNYVTAAANALCGGELDFSWEGGDANFPTVILNNNTRFVSKDECSDPDYVRNTVQHYQGFRHNKVKGSKPPPPINLKDLVKRRQEAVLKNGFKACDEGNILEPNKDPKKQRCHPIPEKLKEVIEPMGVKPGGNAVLPECKRFDVKGARSACKKEPDPPYCQWNWLSKVCEGRPPGEYYSRGCEMDNGTHLNETCYIWEDLFGQPHPIKNCEIVHSCGGDINSCYLAGELSLDVRNEPVFTANKSASETAIRSGLAAALKVPSRNVAILQVSGWDFNFPSNMKELASAAGWGNKCEDEDEGASQCGEESQCVYDKDSDTCYDDSGEVCDTCPEASSSDEYPEYPETRRLQAGIALQDPYRNMSVVTGGRAFVKWAVSRPSPLLIPDFLQFRRGALLHIMNRAFRGNTTGPAPPVISGATFLQPGTFSTRVYGEALLHVWAELEEDEEEK